MRYEISKTINGQAFTESFVADFKLDDDDFDVARLQGLETQQDILLYFIRAQFKRPELFTDEDILAALRIIAQGEFELELID